MNVQSALAFFLFFAFLPFPFFLQNPSPCMAGAVSASDAEPCSSWQDPLPHLLQSAYGGGEQLRYSVSWLGIEAGELFMEIGRDKLDKDRFSIVVTSRSSGILAFFYPVDDLFETIVSGRCRLPRKYEMIQREGKRRNNKITFYDQQKFIVTYRKNNKDPQVFRFNGPMHNEFSSFLFLRVMDFVSQQEMRVPTFADKKRHEVLVTVEGREKLQTLLGQKHTWKIRPHLPFRGLYGKVGDPFIWLTDDDLRIPVKIKAQIIIGSLVADLVEYRRFEGGKSR